MIKLFTTPNWITLANLISGCLGLIYVLQFQDLKTGGLLIVLSLIFDFFDGFSARLLKVSSEIGKQLDSLADVVSFGVLPGMILYMLIENSAFFPAYFSYAALAIPAFSALRLAKFNIDTRQAYGFIGLPTPANAVVIAVFPFLTDQYPAIADWINNSWFLIGYIIVFSYLLISELPLPALKFKTFQWKGNEFIFISMGLSVLILLLFKLLAIPLIVFIYIIYSIVVFFKTPQG